MIYLLKFKYLYFFVMILCCFFGRSSEVEANQVFKIENIEVDKASHTAIAARKKALEKGQKKANVFFTVVGVLLSAIIWAYIFTQ